MLFIFFLSRLPPGDPEEGPVVIFLRRSLVLGRFRPESGGKLNFNCYFDLKYGWDNEWFVVGRTGAFLGGLATGGRVASDTLGYAIELPVRDSSILGV